MIFTRRHILILALAVLAVVGIAVGIVLVVNASPKLQNTVTKLANIKPVNSTPVPLTTNGNTNSGTATAEITYVARAFTERFGTTNNQQPDVILLALPFATTKLQGILQTNVASLKQQPLPKSVMTISTTARVFQVTSITATAAHLVVSTTREQTVDSTSTSYHQDLNVDLLREQGSWKVSAATWQPR